MTSFYFRSFFVLSFAVFQFTSSERIGIKLLSARTENECYSVCDRMGACREYSYSENEGCLGHIDRHQTQYYTAEKGPELLQIEDPGIIYLDANCTTWREEPCGWQVPTFLDGDCQMIREPDTCLGYCSDGCVFFPAYMDVCEASCQPGDVFLTIVIDQPNPILLQLVDQTWADTTFCPAIPVELDIDPVRVVECLLVDSNPLGATITLTINPVHGGRPTVQAIASIVPNVVNGDYSQDFLSIISEMSCRGNCREHAFRHADPTPAVPPAPDCPPVDGFNAFADLGQVNPDQNSCSRSSFEACKNTCSNNDNCLAFDYFLGDCCPWINEIPMLEEAPEGVCTYVRDVDECLNGSSGCSPDAVCTNLPGGFTCECPEGYSGDGVTCVVSCACDRTPDNMTWCTHGGSQVSCQDCDLDGQLDTICTDEFGNFGVMLSSLGCVDNNWPNGHSLCMQ